MRILAVPAPVVTTWFKAAPEVSPQPGAEVALRPSECTPVQGNSAGSEPWPVQTQREGATLGMSSHPMELSIVVPLTVGLLSRVPSLCCTVALPPPDHSSILSPGTHGHLGARVPGLSDDGTVWRHQGP